MPSRSKERLVTEVARVGPDEMSALETVLIDSKGQQKTFKFLVDVPWMKVKVRSRSKERPAMKVSGLVEAVKTASTTAKNSKFFVDVLRR